MNFLMDRSGGELGARVRPAQGGDRRLRPDGPLVATGALSGRFAWTCARGRLEGQLLLAPTNPPTIQALRLRVEP